MAGKKIKITSIDTDAQASSNPDSLDNSVNAPRAKTIRRKPPQYSFDPSKTQSAIMPNAYDDEGLSFGWAKILGIISFLIWIALIAVLLFVVLDIHKNWQGFSALEWAGIIGLIFGSASLLFIASYAIKQLGKLSTLASQLNLNAQTLSQPDQAVIGKTKIMSEAIRAQISEIDDKINASLGRLTHMDEVVQTQTSRLDAANQAVKETSDLIAINIEQNAKNINNMEAGLKQSLDNISSLLAEHREKLETSMQISSQKVKEARIALDGAIAKLNTASDIVRSNTVQAASTLSASHEDIQSLGEIIRLRSDELDDVYKRHGAELTAMIEHLREEQQVLGANMEERLSKMRDLSLSAQASAESLLSASSSGKETIEALAEAAELSDTAIKKRFEDMREMVRYSTEQTRNITDIATNRVNDSLELTRREIARIEKDMQEMQARVQRQNTKALELVETSDSNKIGKNKIGKKRHWTRLKLMPVLDEIETEQTPEPPQKHIQDRPKEESPALKTQTLQETQEHQETQKPQEIHTPQSKKETELPPVNEQEYFHDDIMEILADTETSPEITQKREESETLRRPAIERDPNKTNPEPKRGLFRSLFGKRKPESSSSLDIVSVMGDDKKISAKDISQQLETLGIGANLVVDEGCIIEATNARVSKGHLAMSRVVVMRLKGPVSHLTKAISLDEKLSDDIIAFATEFNAGLTHLSGNREAIRKRLETEAGRAYLLCDAALNSQKV